MSSSKDTKTMSEPQNDKPPHKLHSDPAFERRTALPKPSDGTAYGNPDVLQTPPTALKATDETVSLYVPFYVSLVKSIMDRPEIFDDEFLKTIQEQFESAKSRLAHVQDRHKDSSPTMHAKRQELINGAEKYLELLVLTKSVLEVSLRLRDLDAQMEKLRREREPNWNAETDRLVIKKVFARMEMGELKSKLHRFEAQENN
ncbi:hypothetical protein EAF04_003798 [Stromatinia cepivora]|nr:hypothetical protein EAF04_003798 [Stromatinia cepivora]